MSRKPKTVPPGYYRLEESPVGYRIIKYHHKSGLEESRYDLIEMDGQLTCNCPQMARETCRHRQMYPALLERVNTQWFYLFPNDTWHDLFGGVKAGDLVDEVNGDSTKGLYDQDVLEEALGIEPEGHDPEPVKYTETEHGLKVPVSTNPAPVSPPDTQGAGGASVGPKPTADAPTIRRRI